MVEIDFRYVYVEYEFAAVGHMLRVIEPEIERLAAMNEEETLADLEAKGWLNDEAEWQFAHQHIDDMRDYVLPRFMRGPLVVALWGAYEAVVNQGAWTRAAEMGLPGRFGRGSAARASFPVRAREYFNSALGLPLDRDSARFDRLADLYLIRNALAHANGLKDGMTDGVWRTLRDVGERAGAPVDEGHDMLVLPRSFVERAYADLTESARDLVARARAAGR